jgi:hypothetical protein
MGSRARHSTGRKAKSRPTDKGKRNSPRRKPAHSLEGCGAVLTILIGPLSALNQAARDRNVPQFLSALRILRNACVAGEMTLEKAVRS